MKFTARIVDNKIETKNIGNTPQFVESMYIKFKSTCDFK